MYAMKPFNNHTVTVKIPIGMFEISVAFDDSCGALEQLSRGDIRVFMLGTGEDITNLVSNDTIPATIENLLMVYAFCLASDQKSEFIFYAPPRSKELDDFLQAYVKVALEMPVTINIFGNEETLPKEEAMHRLWLTGIRREYNAHVITGTINYQEFLEYCCKQDTLLWAEQEKKLLEEGSKV